MEQTATTIEITSGARDLLAMTQRVAGNDVSAAVRLRAVKDNSIEVLFTTPFGTIVSRQVVGTLSEGASTSATFAAMSLLEALSDSVRDAKARARTAEPLIPGEAPAQAPASGVAGGAAEPAVGDSCTITLNSGFLPWPGALPPVDGFVFVDELDREVINQLGVQGRELARQFAGPAGLPKSLLAQKVVHLEGEGDAGGATADINMRMVLTSTSLGLVPRADAPAHVPRCVRVSARGEWVRADTPWASVYYNYNPSLLQL